MSEMAGDNPGRYEFGFCAELGGVEFDIDVVADLAPRADGDGLDAQIQSVTFSDGGGTVPDAICDALDLEAKAVEHFMDYAPVRGEFLPGHYRMKLEGPHRECDLIGFVKEPGRAHYYALVTAPGGVGFALASFTPFRCGDWERVDDVKQRVVRDPRKS